MNQAVKAITVKTGKYLMFFLENEEYGIGILKVKEIIGMMPITSVSRTPEFVKGVINLRGEGNSCHGTLYRFLIESYGNAFIPV